MLYKRLPVSLKLDLGRPVEVLGGLNTLVLQRGQAAGKDGLTWEEEGGEKGGGLQVKYSFTCSCIEC